MRYSVLLDADDEWDESNNRDDTLNNAKELPCEVTEDSDTQNKFVTKIYHIELIFIFNVKLTHGTRCIVPSVCQFCREHMSN